MKKKTFLLIFSWDRPAPYYIALAMSRLTASYRCAVVEWGGGAVGREKIIALNRGGEKGGATTQLLPKERKVLLLPSFRTKSLARLRVKKSAENRHFFL